MTKQRLYTYLFLLVCLIFLPKAKCQDNIVLDSLNLEVEVNVHNEIIYIHTIQKKETLYSISKFFKIPYKDLLRINNLNPSQTIQIGSQIKIPLNFELAETSIKNEYGYLPIIYRVKRRETLFKLSHVYFPQTIQNLINRNNVKTFALRENQPMVVGWWPLNNTTNEELTLELEEPVEALTEAIDTINSTDSLDQDIYSRVLTLLDDLNLEDHPVDSTSSLNPTSLDLDSLNIAFTKDSLLLSEPLVIQNIKGIAYWDKAGADYENLFVMHNNARENSYIKLKNPLTSREVIAKVIMQIPKGIYTSDIDIVITPAVAKSLGALDSRFRIEMEYYE